MNRLATFALLFVAGCGGIPDSTLLADLTDEDAVVLCDEFVERAPTQEYTCDFGGVTTTIEVGFAGTAQECVDSFEPAPEGCVATVGDMRACVDALVAVTEEQVCGGEEIDPPASCLAVFDCYQ
ncbi:MAG: hypothetical protein H6737_20985 [Alphaproteobacteria bacterium]|nr:hypothetical protein [Alphaproteobacteria bacterium]